MARRTEVDGVKVDLSCPVEVIAYELPTPEQPYCSLVLFNLEEKLVRSVQVSLALFDGEGNAVTQRMERAMGLEGESKGYFEINVGVADGAWVRGVFPTVEKVWFDDATVWRRNQSADQDYEPNALPAGRMLDHLRLIAGADALGFPSDQGPLWICVCGRPNPRSEAVCRRCGRDCQQMFAQFNPAAVQTWMEEHDRRQQEQAKRLREEEAREAARRKAEAARKRRRRRFRAAAAISLLVIAAAAYLFIVYGVPELRYRQAEDMLAGGNARKAKEVFVSLGSYRGADQRARDADFSIAMEMVRDSAQREEGLRLLDAMTDHPEAAAEAQKARYAEAEQAADLGEYERAEALLLQVGEYGDSPELLRNVSYQIASMQMDKGEYESAAKRFRTLGEYRDAATRVQDCVYRQAGKALEAAEYLVAKSLYASIPDYQDSVERARDCVYRYALELKSEERYDEARLQFDKLGAYLDSADQAMACGYAQATARMRNGKYDEAAGLFAAIAGYEDADELAKECSYLPAAAHYERGEYQQAIDLWLDIADYKDSDARAKQAAYQIAHDLQESGKLTEAAAAFDALGDHEDASRRASGARYEAAQAAQEAGDHAEARALFAALGDYLDAASRADACGYALAKALLDAGDFGGAGAAFRNLGAYDDAATQANLCDYKRAEQLRAEGRLEDAAALFASLGKFQDSMTQANACRYALAEAYETRGEYAKAGKGFAALSNYIDAGERSRKAYDLWLADLQLGMEEAMNAEDYTRAMRLIEEGAQLEELPPQYAGLEAMYYEANLEYAKQLIASGNSLLAYPYLQRAAGTREARNLLKGHVFLLLGAWDSADGSHAEFRADGVCVIDGQERFFNVDGYGLMVGDTAKPQTRTHAIVQLDERRLTLQREADGVTVKYTRAASAEEPAGGQ